MSRSKTSYDFVRYLNPALAENPLFRDLFRAVGAALDRMVVEPTEQLARIRTSKHIRRGDYYPTGDGRRGQVGHLVRGGTPQNPVDTLSLMIDGDVLEIETRALQNRAVLIEQAYELGFDYFSDTLSDEDYERIIDYAGRYWPNSGKPEFINFIGFVKNMRLTLNILWDRDYTEGVDSDTYERLEQFNAGLNSPVWDGGKDYPTSHVELAFDALTSPTPDMADLINLFYFFAPINLVLQRIGSYIDIPLTYTLVNGGLLSLTEGAQISPPLDTATTVGFTHFQMGLMPQPELPNGNSALVSTLPAGALSTFASAYQSTDALHYTVLDTNRLMLKCWVPAERTYFAWNTVLLWARVNGGAPAPYSVHWSQVRNPKFSTERNSWGISYYLLLEVTLPPGVTLAQIDTSALVQDVADFKRVPTFFQLYKPAREDHDAFVLGSHFNTSDPRPHVAFVSEDTYYGSFLMQPDRQIITSEQTYYAFGTEYAAVEGFAKIEATESNSGVDFLGRPLYVKANS